MKKLSILALVAALAGCAQKQTQHATETIGEKMEYVTNESLLDAYYRLTNPADSSSPCATTPVLRTNVYLKRKEFVVAWGGTFARWSYIHALVRGHELPNGKTKLVYTTNVPNSGLRKEFAACIQAGIVQ